MWPGRDRATGFGVAPQTARRTFCVSSSSPRKPPLWCAQRRAYRPCAASRASWVPCSTIDLAVEYDEPVHCRDGRQPVRDGDHGLAAHERRQGLLDRRLDLGIQRAGGLVQ